MKDFAIKIKPRANLSQTIAQQIQESIFRLKMQPGDQLPSENDLAKQFGVGRPTIREAIKRLEAMGLVEIERGRGTMVKELEFLRAYFNNMVGREPWLARLEALGQFRQAIEDGMLQLVIEFADEQDFAALAEAAECLCNHVDGLGPFLEADSRFHAAMYKATKNEYIMALLPVIDEHFALQKRAMDAVPPARNSERLRLISKRHLALFKAIKQRDLAAARAAASINRHSWKEMDPEEEEMEYREIAEAKFASADSVSAAFGSE